MKRKTWLLTTLSLLIAIIGASAADLQPQDPKLIAVRCYADWCSKCKTMDPIVNDLQNKLDGKPVLFVTMDLTNTTRANQSSLLAHELGIASALGENKGTGFLLILDENKKVVDRFSADKSLKEIYEAIDAKLKQG